MDMQRTPLLTPPSVQRVDGSRFIDLNVGDTFTFNGTDEHSARFTKINDRHYRDDTGTGIEYEVGSRSVAVFSVIKATSGRTVELGTNRTLVVWDEFDGKPDEQQIARFIWLARTVAYDPATGMHWRREILTRDVLWRTCRV